MKAFLLILFSLSLLVKAENWPPKGTTQVKAYSFSGGPGKLILHKASLDVSAKPLGGVLLNQKQINRLSKLLRVESNHYGMGFLTCFEPRDALVCYNQNEQPIAALSICLTCYRFREQPKSSVGEIDYALMAQFFADLKMPNGYQFKDPQAESYSKHYRKKVIEWKEKAAKKVNRPLAPEPWKTAKPTEKVTLQIGDQVYLSSWIPYDPFDGPKIINEKGEITPNLCKDPVKIVGLNEVEASKIVRSHAIQQTIYNDHPTVLIKVISAKRIE
ncbi:hypothetical protein N9Z02_01350 [Akkermansiaceae bacterium]|nr:hypothetical protein [Akkermansiaceae bacterium]